jgi:DNA-binding response OmpR family regulator
MTDGAVRQKIVIVEDNMSLAEIYKTRLELIGYTCFIAYNGIIGLYFIQKEQPDLVLLDLMVPDFAGDQILQHMRTSQWGKDIPVFVISNLNEADAPAGLRELGISGYAVKANLSDDDIDKIVEGVLKPSGTQVSSPAPAEPKTDDVEVASENQ